MKDEIQLLMRGIRKTAIPDSDDIVAEAFSELGYVEGALAPAAVRLRFNELLYKVWEKTLEVLERYEGDAYSRGIPDGLLRLRQDDVERSEGVLRSRGFAEAVRLLFQRWYPALRRCFQSISQSRMTRGGRDFELQFGRLLDLMGVPYQKLRRSYRVDFMMPSDEAFRSNPTSAAIASAKRTLRERWRQVVEELEAMRSPNIFLVTADQSVSPGHVEQICGQYRIHLVVWDHVKTHLYPSEPLVLGYTQWANERLPALEQFWPRV